MLNEKILAKMSQFEKRRYDQLSQDYWDVVEKLGELQLDPIDITGNLDLGDLRRIESTTFLAVQTYESIMRSK